MPISNPIIQGLTVNQITQQYITQGADVTLSNIDPFEAPTETKKFWLNQLTKKLFLAIATNSLSDWIAIGGDTIGAIDWDAIANKPNTFPVDTASILNKILVQNGAVLTTDDNVIFED